MGAEKQQVHCGETGGIIQKIKNNNLWRKYVTDFKIFANEN